MPRNATWPAREQSSPAAGFTRAPPGLAPRAAAAQFLTASSAGEFGRVVDPDGDKIELWEPPPGQ